MQGVFFLGGDFLAILSRSAVALGGFGQALREFGVELREQDDSVLIAAGGVHDDPCAGFAAFVARGVRHVGRDEALFAFAQQDALFQAVAVVHGAFALEHVGDGLDSLVVMGLGDGTGGHRQDVHADILRADRFGGRARAVGEALLAEIILAWRDDGDAVVLRGVQCGSPFHPVVVGRP